MTLIYGGAYQGKLDFALKYFSKNNTDVFHCEDGNKMDFSKEIINNFERYLLGLIHKGKTPTEWVESHMEELANKTILLQDVSCGVVPMEKDLRLWREEVGRVAVMLSHESKDVYRLYCGIPTKLK